MMEKIERVPFKDAQKFATNVAKTYYAMKECNVNASVTFSCKELASVLLTLTDKIGEFAVENAKNCVRLDGKEKECIKLRAKVDTLSAAARYGASCGAVADGRENLVVFSESKGYDDRYGGSYLSVDEVIDEVLRCRTCILCPLRKDSFSCGHVKDTDSDEGKAKCAESIRAWSVAKEGL